MNGIDSFHWNLARGLLGISTAFALLGICCNSLIFVTTVRTKSLRATYNILIAICSFADVVHQFGTLVQIPFLFGYDFEMDRVVCVAVLYFPEMGIAIGITCILCVGIDRMIAILFITRYRMLNKTYFHLCLAIPPLTYCTYLSTLMWGFLTPGIVLCQVMEPYSGAGRPWFTRGNLTVIGFILVVHFIIWMALRSRKDSSMMKRIIKSLFIIMAVDCGGWCLTPGTMQISDWLNLEPQQRFVWSYISIIFVNSAISVKFFVYYTTSSEYKAAFRTMFFKNKTINIRAHSSMHQS